MLFCQNMCLEGYRINISGQVCWSPFFSGKRWPPGLAASPWCRLRWTSLSKNHIRKIYCDNIFSLRLKPEICQNTSRVSVLFLHFQSQRRTCLLLEAIGEAVREQKADVSGRQGVEMVDKFLWLMSLRGEKNILSEWHPSKQSVLKDPNQNWV